MRHLLVIYSLMVLMLAPVTAQVTYKTVDRFTTTVLNTELNNLAADALSSLSPTINNTVGGGGGDGSLWCEVEGVFTFAANPNAAGTIQIYVKKTLDGTTFEDSVGGATDLPRVTLGVTSGQTTTRNQEVIDCPSGNFKVQVRNAGTGQALAGNGVNTVKIKFWTVQGF